MKLEFELHTCLCAYVCCSLLNAFLTVTVKSLKAFDLDQRLANYGSWAKSSPLPLVSMDHKLRMNGFSFLNILQKIKRRIFHEYFNISHVQIM